MAALSRNLTIEQGTTWAHAFKVTVNGQPITDGYTAAAHIRRTAADADLLHAWSTELGNAGVASGAVTLTVDPAESSAWEWRTGVYDVEITSPDGNVYRVASGSIRVDPEVTR